MRGCAPPTPRLARSATAIKDVAEALKEPIAALSAATVWLALFGAGIMLFWLPGNALEGCPASMNKEPVKSHASLVPPPGDSQG